MFLILLLASSSSILAHIYAFLLFLKCLLTSRLTLIRLSTLLWLGSYIHCIHSEYVIYIAFSTARMVARMGLSVTICLHCLSCLLTSSATKQVRASYPAPSFRRFLSPLPPPQVSVYQNLKMALSVTAAYSSVVAGGRGTCFLCCGKILP